MTKNEIKYSFKKAWDLIDKSQNVFLTTHESTDGDDLGSLLAIKHVLEKMDKTVTAAVKGGVPNSLIFLPQSQGVLKEFTPNDYDLIITFGCNTPDRPGFPELKNVGAPLINFDHHPDNKNFGTVNVVDSRTAAVAELIFYFLDYRNISIDKDTATCILTGIFTDTGGFKHSNTTAEVLQVASELLKKGARIDKIATYTFGQNRPQTMKAWSKALENTRFDSDKQMVFSIVTEDELKDLGATEEDLAGFVTILNHIPQAKFALLLRQDGDVIKGSLRSEPHKNTDVSKIAHSFGGGGHKLAAGFKIKGKLIKKDDKWEVQ
jgi:bifunctional oligoribonuclease and PAP phosphatase NrnA